MASGARRKRNKKTPGWESRDGASIYEKKPKKLHKKNRKGTFAKSSPVRKGEKKKPKEGNWERKSGKKKIEKKKKRRAHVKSGAEKNGSQTSESEEET